MEQSKNTGLNKKTVETGAVTDIKLENLSKELSKEELKDLNGGRRIMQ